MIHGSACYFQGLLLLYCGVPGESSLRFAIRASRNPDDVIVSKNPGSPSNWVKTDVGSLSLIKTVVYVA